MTISDAQFSAWLRKDVRRAVLCEIAFAYESGSAQQAGTIYLSDCGYRTGPADSPASVSYAGIIESAPDFERKIDVNTLGGRALVSVGSMTLANADGAADFLLDAIIDGREARFYLGAPDWPRSDFRLMYVATVSKVSTDTQRLTVQLRDKGYLLDNTIIGDTIASGPNAGKPKPILLGRVKNFDLTPYMLDSSALTYYVNNFALDATFGTTIFPTVRDNGVSLTDLDYFFMDSGSTTADAGTDTITQVGHGLAENDVVRFGGGGGSLFAGLSAATQYWVIAAGLTADDFRLSLTKGGAAVDITGTAISGSWACDRRRFYCNASVPSIQLSSPPAGRVTLDMTAVDAGGDLGTAATPHRAFEYLLEHHTALDAADYDSAALATLDTAETSEVILYGRAILDRMNVLDLLDEIAFSTCSWYAWNAAGVLTVGRFDLANIDSATAIDTISAADMHTEPSCENLPLQWGKVTLDARRNVVVQTDGLADSVSAANRSLWGQPFQKRASTTDPAGTTYLANWWDYHASAIDSRPMVAEIDAGQQTVVDAITALFKPWTRVLSCTVGLGKYALNPGDCVEVTFPRFGLAASKNFRVAGVRTRLTEQLVELALVTRATPDYTSASHY